MKLFPAMVLSVLLLSATGIPASAQPALQGEWVGGYMLKHGRFPYLPVAARFKSDAGQLSATLDLPLNPETAVALTQIRFQPPNVYFELPRRAGPLVFEGKIDADVITGEIRHGEQRGTFHLVRTVSVAPKVLDDYVGDYDLGRERYVSIGRRTFPTTTGIEFSESDPSHPGIRFGHLFPTSETAFVAGPGRWMPYPVEINAAFVRDGQGRVTALKWKPKDSPEVVAPKVKLRRYVEDEVKFTNGNVTLAATLTLPVTKGPHPAAVFIVGSEPSGRARGTPQFFARHGIAALSYDKRGTGASTGDLKTATFDDLAADVSAAVRFLRSRNDIGKIGVWAISQGGWIAPLVATRTPDIAFMILHAGPAVTPRAQGRMELVHTFPFFGHSSDDIKEAVEYQSLYFDAMRSDAAYEKLRAAYDKAQAAGKRWAWNPGPKERVQGNWSRLILDFDPIPVLEKVKCPVLAFFGEKDLLVPADENKPHLEAALRKAGNTDVTIKVLPNVNHRFEVPGFGAHDYGTSGRSVPGYFDVMVEWIKKRAPVTTDGPRPHR